MQQMYQYIGAPGIVPFRWQAAEQVHERAPWGSPRLEGLYYQQQHSSALMQANISFHFR